MPIFSRVFLVAGLSYATVEAARDQNLADIHMHQQVSFEDHVEDLAEKNCQRSCYTMSGHLFLQYADDPAALKAKADENCASPKCKGCRRTSDAATTMPDCGEPAAAKTEEPAPAVQSEDDDAVEPSKSDPCLDKVEEGEVCDWVDTAWCIAPSVNKFPSCRKGGKPFCCSKIAEVAAPEVAAPSAKVTDPEPAPQPTEDDVVEVEDSGDVCADGEFAVETITRKGKSSEICRNTQTKRFAKSICCDRAKKDALAEKQAAMDACANDVKEVHCRDGRFEKKRKKYNVPDSYTCDTQYVCKGRGSAEELVGPVGSVGECAQLKLTAFKTCVAIKK